MPAANKVSYVMRVSAVFGLRRVVATPPIRLRQLTNNLKYWINELAQCVI